MKVHTINGTCYAKCVDVNQLQQERDELAAYCEMLKNNVTKLEHVLKLNSDVMTHTGIVYLTEVIALLNQAPQKSLAEVNANIDSPIFKDLDVVIPVLFNMLTNERWPTGDTRWQTILVMADKYIRFRNLRKEGE